MPVLAKASVKILEEEMAALKSERTTLDTLYDELRRKVMPTGEDFYSFQTKNIERHLGRDEYDSFPGWAAEQLANGIYTNLHPEDDQWFRLLPIGTPFQNLQREEQEYLQGTAEVMYHHMALSDSGFYTSLGQSEKELVTYGTNIVFAEKDLKRRSINYVPFSLAGCMIKANNNGVIDTMYRRFRWTLRKIIQEWGEENLPETIHNKLKQGREKALREEYDIVHTVKPRKDISFPIRNISKTKPFVSIYWMSGECHGLSVGTFDQFPYHVGRWSMLPGYVYGNSPGINALLDIRSLNTMNRDMFSYSQMNLFPPLVMEDDGFIPPIEYVPGSMILKTPGAEDPKQLPTGGNPNITFEMMQQKREQIANAFYIDFLLRERKKARQTTFEVADERQEMLQQLGPIFANYKKEFLTRLVQTTYNYLDAMGQLPELPPSFRNTRFKVSYQGRAAQAQLAIKADNMTRFVQDLVPLLQIDQNILRAVKFDEVAEQFAVYRDIDMKVLKSQAEIQLELQQEQAQQALQQTVDVAAPAASAAKDIATAQSTLSQI